jgi:hypothetical protein
MSKMFSKKDKQDLMFEQQTTEEKQSMQVSESFDSQSNNDSNLDINLIIASFQEKLSQLMTEVVIKDATIKQLTAIIEKQKGH